VGKGPTTDDIQETAQRMAEVLAEIRQLSFESEEAAGKFRQRALEVIERLNAFLKNLQIPERYVDFPSYSRYYGADSKWETGYRLIIEESQLMVEEFDEWMSYMYPDSKNPVLSFASLSTERLADAIEQIPDFLRYVAERLSERKMKYQQLSSIAQAFLSVLQSEADAL
jgi:predicted transcriptional regulator